MIQDSLLLDSEQAGYLGRLEVGWSIVRLQGRWFWPFLVKFPLVKFEKGVITDARLRKTTKEKQKDLSCLLSISGKFSSTISAEDSQSCRENGSKQSISTTSHLDKSNNRNEKERVTLTAQEEKFLMDIMEHPTSKVTERYSRIGVNVRCGNDV